MKIFSAVALLLALTGGIANAQNLKNADYNANPNRCSYVPPRQADNWLFYQNAGLKFSDHGVAVNHPVVANLPIGAGTASISDEDGNLILYTNGSNVWNSNHQVIATGLAGNLYSNQNSIIVPRPGSSNLFYVFTTDLIDFFNTSKGLNYTLIDMALNNNAGGVAEVNVNLMAKCTQMISGVQSANGMDTWVLAHTLESDEFYAYKIDSNGVNPSPVISRVGAAFNSNPNGREYLGTIKFSPKGDKLAYASFGKGIVELFSFNNETGEVGYTGSVSPTESGPAQGPYYVEFSPDGSKLYFTVPNLNILTNKLYQYDISSATETVLNTGTMDQDVWALQLGRDGKIYVTHDQKSTLGVIENPNRAGIDCNYNEAGFEMSTATAKLGLTNFNQSYFDIPPVDYDTKCEGDATEFYLLNISNITSIDWDFGDPGSNGNIITGADPTVVQSHVYSTTGVFNVSMTEYYLSGPALQRTFTVQINALPAEAFEAEKIYLFPGSTIPLSAPENMYSYNWLADGSSNQTFNATEPGNYTVQYTDIKCCSNEDAIEVLELDIRLPNAFRPVGSIVEDNKTFKLLGPTEANDDVIEDVTFLIYNRWGQLMWEARNADDAWDGTFKGQMQPAGIYIWDMSFKAKENVMAVSKAKYRGVVTLLR